MLTVPSRAGIPIASVRVALVPLPTPHHDSLADCEVHQVRLHAATLPAEAWIDAELDAGPAASAGASEGKKKQWGWTLFSTQVPLDSALLVGAREAALVAYATDANGERQELQTAWNLRGVAEASWGVVKVKLAPEA